MPEQWRRDASRSNPECVMYQCPSKQIMSPLSTERPYVDVRLCRDAKRGHGSLPQMRSADRLLSRKALDIRCINTSYGAHMPVRASMRLPCRTHGSHSDATIIGALSRYSQTDFR